MKSFVITIMHLEDSVKLADRCIASAKKVGIDVEKFPAITPYDDPVEMAAKLKIPTRYFENDFCRFENAVATYLSHYSLWKKCIELNRPILILEHDAVFVNNLVPIIFNKCISIGKPSYGGFNTPPSMGVNPLSSKPYFPGAHAYILKPSGAYEFVRMSKTHAGPADVYLHAGVFPWLQELYPWPVEVRDSFSTIQVEKGCLAKHNYNENFEIKSV